MRTRHNVLGIALAAATLFGASRMALADTLVCLYVDQPGSVPPAYTGALGAPCVDDGSLVQINLCLETDATGGQTGGPSGLPNPLTDITINTGVIPPQIDITAHYGVSGVAGVDAEAHNFPSASPEGHLSVWVDGVPVLEMGAAAAVADRQTGCPDAGYN